MSWIKKEFVLKSHEFQQDGKPAHNSHLVLNIGSATTWKYFGPRSSGPQIAPTSTLWTTIFRAFLKGTPKSPGTPMSPLYKKFFKLDSRNYER
jgi:hypothetical protein